MARLEREAEASGPAVTAFTVRGYRCGETEYPGGLLLTPERASAWDASERLIPGGLDALLSIEPPPEFLLLGTGAILRRPDAEFVAALEARGIGVEAMDSRAAARSWAMLRAEGRWIVAALMPLHD